MSYVMALAAINDTFANEWHPPALGLLCTSHARVSQQGVKGPLPPSCGEEAKDGHTMPKAFATESVENWELNIEILLLAA